MNQYLSAGASEQTLLDRIYPYSDNRIDCLFIKRYYQINDNTFKMLTLFNPSDYGIEQLKENERGLNIMALQDKINASRKVDNKKVSGLKAKINASRKVDNPDNQSFNDKSQINIDKFIQVENLNKNIMVLTEKIDSQGELIAELMQDFSAISKLMIENNSYSVQSAKDSKSCLNAINAIHGKFANIGNFIDYRKNDTTNKGNQSDNQKVITRKKTDNHKQALIINESMDNEGYQGFYEHFKSYFSHKFAKSNQCDNLDIFMTFINPIDFYSLQSINDTTRKSWQDYRSDTSQMIFAPGSMELCLQALIKTGIDFDLIKDFSPIIDNKCKPEILKRLNSEFASNESYQDTNIANTEIKDFKYWANALQVNISIIKECIDSLKDKDDKTLTLCKEYIVDKSSLNEFELTELDDFIDYLDNTNFAG